MPAGSAAAWNITPIALFVVFDTVSLYRNALDSINIAYDRSLLASARSIGELLEIEGTRLKVELPYTALEIFDAGDRGRIITAIVRDETTRWNEERELKRRLAELEERVK